MKVAAVVILYYPSSSIIPNIKSYSSDVEKIFVFDNSEKESDFRNQICSLDNVEYFHDGANRGIAERLNQACKMAMALNFDWLLTMDQDTCFLHDSLKAYFHCVTNYDGSENVAMFGVKYQRSYSPSSFECEAEDSDELITSGSLINLHLVDKVGYFDQSLFIDLVDNDYCYRANLLGLGIKVLKNIILQHELGTLVFNASIKTLYLWKKKKIIHSPIRCYYLYRNMLYLQKRYAKTNPELSEKIKYQVIKHLKKTLTYSNEPIKVLKYIRKARLDFKNNKMGKIQIP